MDRLDSIRQTLRLETAPICPDFAAILAELAAQKRDAVARGHEQLAKDVWCLEQVARAQSQYVLAFRQLKDESYFEAWCTLEQVEITLHFLRPHFDEQWTNHRLDFIDRITTSLQSLYPYKLFGSPEIIHDSECTICDTPIAVRNPCGHKPGEVYAGELCGRRFTNIEFVAMAIVENPVQKYSVIHTRRDDKTLYPTVKYLVDRWPHPFANWDVEWTTREHPKAKFKALGRNDKCPCESGKKYKKCCSSRHGIVRPHLQFNLHFEVLEGLMNLKYTY